MSRFNISVIWDYFDKTNDADKKAKCRVCGDLYSYKGSTGNLKAHLKKRHLDAYTQVVTAQRQTTVLQVPPAVIDVPDSVPTASATAAAAMTCTTEGPSTSTSIPTAATSSTTTVRKQPPKQYTMERYGSTKKISNELKRKIDSDLLDLFVASYQPFSLVEEKSFKKFASWIPGYQLPSRKTISHSMIPNLYNTTKEKLKIEFMSSNIENICLTADLWTSRINESYLAVTGHYITEDLELKTVLLDCFHFPNSHTTYNIQSALLELAEEWSIKDKVNFIVTDNAANIQRAVNNIGWEHYGCYAHTLNLIVQDALRSLAPSLEKVKKIVRFFKTSSTALEKLLKAQTNDVPNCVPKRMVQEVPTRWNSTFHMLQRFVELEQYLRATIAIIKKDLPIITNEEWIFFGELCKILKPFDEATVSMSSENHMTAGSIIVVTRCLVTACDKLLAEEFTEPAQDCIYRLRTGLVTRFANVEKSGTFSICTVLDPRYKLAVFADINEARNARKKVQDLLADLIDSRANESQHVPSIAETHGDKFSPWSILQEMVGQQYSVGTPVSKSIKELDTYINDDILPAFSSDRKMNCPLNWWRTHRFTYPYLSQLLRRYGNIMASSVPCERIFSKTGLIINDRRTSLSTDKVRQLVFLNVNLDRFK